MSHQKKNGLLRFKFKQVNVYTCIKISFIIRIYLFPNEGENMNHFIFNVGVIFISTENDKFSSQIAAWVADFGNRKKDAHYELVDINDYALSLENRANDSKILETWEAKMKRYNALLFITQEYSHFVTSSIKNAILVSKPIWYKKVAGIISYGSSDGIRAMNHLKEVMNEVKMTNVRIEVTLPIFMNADLNGMFSPDDAHQIKLESLLDQVNAWGKAALAFM